MNAGDSYRDLGGGVFDDGQPEGGALLPPCPICPADKPRVVVFDGTPGEARHSKNQRRRELWADEVRARSDELEDT